MNDNSKSHDTRVVRGKNIPGTWLAVCNCGWRGAVWGGRGARSVAASDKWSHVIEMDDAEATAVREHLASAGARISQMAQETAEDLRRLREGRRDVGDQSNDVIVIELARGEGGRGDALPEVVDVDEQELSLSVHVHGVTVTVVAS